MNFPLVFPFFAPWKSIDTLFLFSHQTIFVFLDSTNQFSCTNLARSGLLKKLQRRDIERSYKIIKHSSLSWAAWKIQYFFQHKNSLKVKKINVRTVRDFQRNWKPKQKQKRKNIFFTFCWLMQCRRSVDIRATRESYTWLRDERFKSFKRVGSVIREKLESHLRYCAPSTYSRSTNEDPHKTNLSQFCLSFVGNPNPSRWRRRWCNNLRNIIRRRSVQ